MQSSGFELAPQRRRRHPAIGRTAGKLGGDLSASDRLDTIPRESPLEGHWMVSMKRVGILSLFLIRDLFRSLAGLVPVATGFTFYGIAFEYGWIRLSLSPSPGWASGRSAC